VSPAFSLCVYCGSKPGKHPAYEAAAQAVGDWIGAHQGQLVYGGGHNGLMGIVADATQAAGGRVVGIIPGSMVEREWARHSCDELHVVATMHERKRMMMERADAFLALPGGIGTFEEFFKPGPGANWATTTSLWACSTSQAITTACWLFWKPRSQKTFWATGKWT